MTCDRIESRFASLKEQKRAALVTFTMAGDPDLDTSTRLAVGLARAGADVIELGMPFSDPMADGPVIQRAGQRALAGGHTMSRTLKLARALRDEDSEIPIVLMGYYNPIVSYGQERFAKDAVQAGVDGAIIVDLPPEEDGEFRVAADSAGMRTIRLATPTTDQKRLPAVLRGSGGFVYYVSITGITGGAAPNSGEVAQAVGKVKASTDLPVCVGFGVRTPDHAAEIARGADGVVVGSAIIERIAAGDSVEAILEYVASLAGGVRGARKQ